MKSSQNSSGFTLIELAIVLVIIGLLIGGILVAQSMITTSNVNAFIRQVGQFDSAVLNFKTKYNEYPGDAPAFGGDGNKQVLSADGSVANFDGEVANFWPHLSLSGFDPQNSYSPTIVTHFSIAQPGANSPASKLGTATGVAVVQLLTTPMYIYADYSGTLNDNVIVRASSIMARDALAIDIKLDDGVRYNLAQSKIIGMGNTNCQAGVANNPGLPYNATASAPGCILYIHVIETTVSKLDR